MKRSVFTSLLAFILIVFISATVGAGCANPIAPSGGPKDTLAPVLVDADPLDSTLNFNNKKIIFSFDEFVVLDNARDNLIVSPVPKIEPVVESKLRTVTVKIKDTLEPNTTYSYNFGDGIRDNNEGNIIKNFTYVFSTGKYIDSLQLNGHVINAQTGQADSTLIVMLHTSDDDSAVIKKKPRYIAKLNNKGDFHFKYLPPGLFYLYALKDEGGQKKYLSKSQLFAFADKPVTIGLRNAADTLYAFVEADDNINKPVKSTPVNSSPGKTDKEKEKDKRLKFTLNLQNGGQQDLLSNLEFTFNDPLKKFDSTKAQLTDEDFKPITKYSFIKDTSNKKLILSYKWPENTAFNFIVDKEFAEDSSGKKIARTDTLKFRTMKESDYGNVAIRFNRINLSKKPVLQLIQSDVVKFSIKLTSRDFHAKLFRPGDYEIRILYDANDNGVWDTGDFFKKHIQPEKVTAIPKKLSIKANWDNDVTVEL